MGENGRTGGSGLPGPDEETRLDTPIDDETIAGGASVESAEDTPKFPSIPGYRVLGVLGEGGMGVVLEAEQDSPRRRVALKMIRGGAFAGERARAMFRREVETLSRLRHPHVASIFDAGASEDGHPYLAMELVEGNPLDVYVQRHRPALDRDELRFRLGLLQRICSAVHYAHQRGVIHRDLKPGNVFVSSEVTDSEGIPLVKVLDFGLARLTDAEPDAVPATEMGAVKGTLAYMSPEQARGNPDEIDTRTDVYALGVMLYETLTGQRPRALDATSFLEAARKAVESKARPVREVWPDGAVRLDSDLETLVHAALQPDRDRRYSGADALARDIGRYLRREPIEARPPSTSYHLRKFAQRNRALVGGVAATALVLVAGAITSTVFGIRAANQRRAAETARQDLERVVEFQERMLADVDPEATGLRLVRALREQVVRDGPSSATAERFDEIARQLNPTDLALVLLDDGILAPASEASLREFGNQPLIRARLHQTLGTTYTNLGMFEDAENEFRRALELRRSALGDEATETLESELKLLGARYRRGEIDEVRARVEDMIERLRQSLGDDHPLTLATRYTQGTALYASGDIEAAIAVYRDVLEDQTRILGAEDTGTLRTLNGIAVALHRRAEYEEAAEAFRRLLDTQRRILGPDDPTTLATMGNLASTLARLEQYEESERLYTEAGDALARTLGENHPRTIRILGNLGFLYGRMGRHQESYELAARSLDARERVLGPYHPETLGSMNNAAYRLMELERYGEAEVLLRRLLDRDDRFQPESPDHALHLHTYAELLMALERWREARGVMTRALALYRRGQQRNLGPALVQAAQIEARLGRTSAAINYLREARAVGYDREIDVAEGAFASLRHREDFRELARPMITEGTDRDRSR